jgi:hypothetical protein
MTRCFLCTLVGQNRGLIHGDELTLVESAEGSFTSAALMKNSAALFGLKVLRSWRRIEKHPIPEELKLDVDQTMGADRYTTLLEDEFDRLLV